MGDPRHVLGLAAEEAVARWLRACGWRIVQARWRGGPGSELDLVAVDPTGALVAVEVRARRTRRTGAAAFSVDERRVARLRRSLASLAQHAGPHAALRVDLVTVEPNRGERDRWRLTRVAGIG